MILTGLRLGELIELKWNQIDWNHKCLTIPRRIPMTLRVQEILRILKEANPDLIKVFGDVVKDFPNEKELRKKIEEAINNCFPKEKLSAAVLRHTFAVGLIQKGVSFSGLYQMMGKDDIGKMMVYFSCCLTNVTL